MLSTNITATAFGDHHTVAAARTAALARIELFDDCAAAAPAWRHLVERDALATPYGRYDWIAAWYRHVSADHGEAPLIAVGFDATETPLFLLPLAVSRRCGVNIAHYAGGSHAQLNLGLWRRDAAPAWQADILRAALADIASRRGIDVFVLRNQPQSWSGIRPPLTLLPHQRSPDSAYSTAWPRLSGDAALQAMISAGSRKRMRAKERKLTALDGYRFFRAVSETEIDELLATFLEQKRRYFIDNCIANPFDEPGVAAFLQAACRPAPDHGEPAIELHALTGDGEVLAVIGGASDGQRFSAMFNSITADERLARMSPGLVLMYNMIRDCVDRGFKSYDHGIGYAPYKQQLCKNVDEMFDSFIGITGRGRIAALAYRLAFAAKRTIKTTTPLWALARGLRQLSGRLCRT